jgi:hypothetical protein
MNPGAEAAREGPDTVFDPNTASQTETSGSQDHPSARGSHISQEVRESQNEPKALSDSRLDMQGGVDGKETEHSTIKPQLLDILTVSEADGATIW